MKSALVSSIWLAISSVAFAQPALPPTSAMSSPEAAKADPGEGSLARATRKIADMFPSVTFDEVKESEIPGIVEIHTPGNIIYFAPDQNILVMGEFWSANGKSITQEKVMLAAASKAGDIDLTSSVTVGKGERQIIAFVNPECGYCKKAHEWFEQKNFAGVRTHYFVMPNPGHVDAHRRAIQAVCAPEHLRAEAIRQLYERSTSTNQSELLSCDFGEAQLAKHAEIAKKVGVSATPFFLVKDPAHSGYEVIAGFAPEKLEPLLSNAKGVSQ